MVIEIETRSRDVGFLLSGEEKRRYHQVVSMYLGKGNDCKNKKIAPPPKLSRAAGFLEMEVGRQGRIIAAVVYINESMEKGWN